MILWACDIAIVYQNDSVFETPGKVKKSPVVLMKKVNNGFSRARQ